MKNRFSKLTRSIGLTLLLMIAGALALANNEADTDSAEDLTPNVNFVFHGQVMIDRPAAELWPELCDFMSWYTGIYGLDVDHSEGTAGQLGHKVTLKSGASFEVISVRPMKNIVRKTCYGNDCQFGHFFSDFSIESLDGKSLLHMKNYAVVTAATVKTLLIDSDKQTLTQQDIDGGKLSQPIQQVLIDFKQHLEKVSR